MFAPTRHPQKSARWPPPTAFIRPAIGVPLQRIGFVVRRVRGVGRPRYPWDIQVVQGYPRVRVSPLLHFLRPSMEHMGVESLFTWSIGELSWWVVTYSRMVLVPKYLERRVRSNHQSIRAIRSDAHMERVELYSSRVSLSSTSIACLRCDDRMTHLATEGAESNQSASE